MRRCPSLRCVSLEPSITDYPDFSLRTADRSINSSARRTFAIGTSRAPEARDMALKTRNMCQTVREQQGIQVRTQDSAQINRRIRISRLKRRRQSYCSWNQIPCSQWNEIVDRMARISTNYASETHPAIHLNPGSASKVIDPNDVQRKKDAQPRMSSFPAEKPMAIVGMHQVGLFLSEDISLRRMTR
jgi:hypothetical protein